MARPSKRVILCPLLAVSSKIAAEPTNITISIISKLSGVTVPNRVTGSPRTIQMLKMLLPIILPTKSSVSPRLAALMVVINSGREVPRATTVRAIMRSEIPMNLATVEAELTTSSAPPTTPARPTRIKTKEKPSLNLGFSTSFSLCGFCVPWK